MSRRRQLSTCVLALAMVALAASAGAVAKSAEGEELEVIELVNEPGDIVTDRAWTAEVRVRPADIVQQSAVAVLIINERTGEQQSFPVERAGDRFTAEVVFPDDERWAYGVARDGRLVAGRDYVDVTEARTRSNSTVILVVSGLLVLGAIVLAVSALRHRPEPVGDASAAG